MIFKIDRVAGEAVRIISARDLSPITAESSTLAEFDQEIKLLTAELEACRDDAQKFFIQVYGRPEGRPERSRRK